MRNRGLNICRGMVRHPNQPVTHAQTECPLCSALERIEHLLVGQKATQDRRCSECAKKQPVNGTAVLGAKS